MKDELKIGQRGQPNAPAKSTQPQFGWLGQLVRPITSLCPSLKFRVCPSRSNQVKAGQTDVFKSLSMNYLQMLKNWFLGLFAGICFLFVVMAASAEDQPAILTPAPPAAPRINGPSIFGVRPWAPFLYRIPVTGDRPMHFSASGLPDWLKLDTNTGEITGDVENTGKHTVILRATNARGTAKRKFRIVVGDQISLTPAMGWNSWNCWGDKVTAEKVLQSARAMARSGLIDHGWTFINIDDAWQGVRGGPFNAIQGNTNFPDMKGLCDEIHDLGLKAGIYSTPWTTSYAGYNGGSSENEDGDWTPPTEAEKKQGRKRKLPWAIGKYSFAANDARQWAAWGIDYLKYDWYPNEVPETEEMAGALRDSGRDVILSLSNSALFTNAPGLSKFANSWRTTGDIRDTWESMRSKGFSQDRWAPLAGPGHWNDPDMLVVGWVGWGRPHPTRLTANEQYTHISMWCLLSAPLLLGCDLQKMDAFTFSLLSNDEVLALDQDALGKQAACVSVSGQVFVYAKDLEGGSKAVGLFNLGPTNAMATVNWSDLKLRGKRMVRDLWRQQDLGRFEGRFSADVPAHGVVLVRLDKRRK
jgi:alpha-galactosidase